jgi:predicted DNA-binding transcriptional regulator YafY
LRTDQVRNPIFLWEDLRVDTPSRLLRLLSLLSTRAWWSAADLADETGVTERTVRRDITRLRELGYPVEATTGRYGGYALGRGGRLPPLVLDDDEAVAVAVALRAAAGGVGDGTSAVLSALAKLDQVLPAGLRERVAAIAAVTVALRPPGLPEVDVDALMTAGLACRRPERLRFVYTDQSDRVTDRLVEPYRLVYTERSWYLVAFDPGRDDWRTFRIDRMSELHLTSQRFVPADDPPDAAALVARGVAVAAYDLQVVVRLPVGVDRARALVGPTVGVVEADPGDDECSLVRIGGDADWIARYLASLEMTVEVVEGDEVTAELRALAHRLLREHRPVRTGAA